MSDTTTTEFLEQDVFVFLDKPTDEDEHNKLLDTISELGGTVARSINKKTTIAICNDINLASEIEKAEKLNIPVVKKEFLTESIKQSKRLEADDYLLKNDKKRKEMDSDSNGDASTANGDSSSSSTDGAAVKKVKLDILKYFEPGCVWCGTCMGEDEAHPMFMRILKFDENAMTAEGETEWPTIDGAKAKFRGSIKDDIYTMEEYEPIDNDLIEQSKYEFTFKIAASGKATLDGKNVELPPDVPASTIKLTMTKKEKIVHLPFLTDGKEFEGDLVQDFKMSMKVTGRKTPKMIEGTIDWVDFSTKTKFKGSVETDGSVQFSEYEVVSGDGVDLPVNYNGKLKSDGSSGFVDTHISGDYKLDSGISGKFVLEK